MHIKDSMEQTENYRPISLLRIISKVLERWVSIKLYNHGKQFISPLQHGFLRNRFCTTQLLSVNAISRNLDKNIQTEVIYLDLAKAFDSVDSRLRHTANISWEFLKIENKQTKQSRTILLDKTGIKLLYDYCRSNKRWTKNKGKTWSRGTNSRLPFGVNVNLNLSNIKNKSAGPG